VRMLLSVEYKFIIVEAAPSVSKQAF
jgi:hypothetical protein